jgi:predicted AAA+ superfamily ATPase
MVKRILQERIEDCFFKEKAVVLCGARQVGKTTLIKEIEKKFSNDALYINCDEPDFRGALSGASSTELKSIIGRKKVVFIDEAQRVRNIGLTLKLLVDNFPDVQVVATGSSSLDLSDEIVEPLTGRKYEFHLHPFSLLELREKFSNIEIKRILEKRIILGMYPEIEEKPDEAEMLLRNLASSYLYKDVLQYQDIRRPELLEKLLTALALQIGNEVSYNELSNLLGVNKQTITNYIQLLEKAFVVFRLQPFSRNLRNELKKLRKIYFYDTGIRNALINNFNRLELRQDVGQLWENFMIAERVKYNGNMGKFTNSYFWRTHRQQEIDYLEEKEGQIAAYEFKWQSNKIRIPKAFMSAYPDSKIQFIDKENFEKFAGL